jgi:tetratricopeptide (TPR) repeat protein
VNRILLSLTLLLTLAEGTRGGIYSPNEPFLFEVDEKGLAQPIQFEGGYDSFLKTFRNIATDDSLLRGGTPNPERQNVLNRVKRRQSEKNLSQEEFAGLTADLIRLGRYTDAINLLQPRVRNPRQSSFYDFTHLSRVHQSRGREWYEAVEQQQAALQQFEFPTDFGSMSKPQLAWLKRVEKNFYLPWLVNRADEDAKTAGRRIEGNDSVDPLFPLSAPRRNTNPLRFVGESGQYEAGTLAASEKAKLPDDAVAILQQMLLWNPQDMRLYWQLAELYNAQGEIEIALKILDECRNLGYSNPVINDHRRILQTAVDSMREKRAAEQAARKAAEEKEQQEREQAERDYQKRFWWIVSIGVALGMYLVYHQLRVLSRKLRK